MYGDWLISLRKQVSTIVEFASANEWHYDNLAQYMGIKKVRFVQMTHFKSYRLNVEQALHHVNAGSSVGRLGGLTSTDCARRCTDTISSAAWHRLAHPCHPGAARASTFCRGPIAPEG